MALFLALASAGLYGAADFLGGLASKSVSTLVAVVASQATGLLVLLMILPLIPANPVPLDYVWGGVAGASGGLGVGLLYRALAIGTMGVVAPATAVCAVGIPVVAEMLSGGRVGGQASAGIAIAVVAILLVTQSRTDGGKLRTAGMGLALLSGAAIGIFFLTLARTNEDAGLWPLVAARAVSVSLFAAAGVATRQHFTMDRRSMALACACGVLDMAANALYLLATRGSSLSIAVTLASLYPASTVMLARWVLRERLTRLQALGMVSALAAVVLIVSA